MKLHKRPVIIEANQYTDPENPPKGSSFEPYPKGELCVYDKDGIWLSYVDDGDWVCTKNGVDYFVLSDEYIKEHFEEVE